MTPNGGAEFGLNDILRMEDDVEIVGITCPHTAIPLWSLLRVPLLREILSDRLYTAPLIQPGARVPVLQATAALARSMVHNMFSAPQGAAEVLIIATGVGNQWLHDRVFNRLADHFALALPDQTVVLEQLFGWQWPFPRYNPRVRMHAPAQAAAAIHGRIACNAGDWERANRLMHYVGQRAMRLLGWQIEENRAARLTRWLSFKAAALPAQYRFYDRLMERLKPCIILAEAACYGTSAALMSVAHDRGIPTAEYQHGAITAGHDAYNVSEALRCESTYLRTMPDTLLGYGEWWMRQSNLQISHVAIGNPHRDMQLTAIAPPQWPVGEKSKLLVLGDGIDTELYLELACSLATRLLPHYEVVFRPHPLERAAVEAMLPSGHEGVRIDPHQDMYTSLSAVDVVVSEVSTGLFEAVGLAKRIFVWDTPKSRFGLPSNPFQKFKHEDELCALLESNPTAAPGTIEVEDIWATDWQNNYCNFLRQHGCVIHEGRTL